MEGCWTLLLISAQFMQMPHWNQGPANQGTLFNPKDSRSKIYVEVWDDIVSILNLEMRCMSSAALHIQCWVPTVLFFENTGYNLAWSTQHAWCSPLNCIWNGRLLDTYIDLSTIYADAPLQSRHRHRKIDCWLGFSNIGGAGCFRCCCFWIIRCAWSSK